MNINGDIKNIQGLLNASSIVGEDDLDFVIDELSISDINPDLLTADEIAFEGSSDDSKEKERRLVQSGDEDIDESIEELSGYTTDSAVKLYLKDVSREVKKHGLLTREQEVELAKRIKRGDEEAKNLLISSNLRLVVSCAKKFANKGVAIEDLIQEGNLGLCIAAGKYDTKKGFKFSTYATWWILQRIRKLIVMKYNVINVPAHVYYKSRAISKARSQFLENYKREPSEQEIADITGLPLRTVRTVINMPGRMIDLDAKIDDSGQATFGDIIPDMEDKEIHTVVENNLLHEQLEEKIDNLLEREQIVVKKYFFEGKSLAQIGNEMGLTRERIRQIKQDAMKKLKKMGLSDSVSMLN